jgi:hypothetical protein
MDIIKNGKIDISEEDWAEFNRTISKDAIKSLLSSAISKVELPYREITPEEARQDFDNLKNLKAESLIKLGEFFSRYEYNVRKSTAYIDLCNIGNKSSDFFHQENRWRCDSINAPSPYRTWTIEKFRLTLLNALWTLKFKKVTNKELRAAIGMRKYIASQFRPSAAKSIYAHFGANSEAVLDTSAGWGDRLSAFLASNHLKYYYGTDPNQNLFAGYNKQVEIFGSSDKKVEVFCDCSESHEYPKNTFDLAFTSPPYFIMERYTKEKNQSWVRYKKLDQWLNNFLYPTIKNTENALKSGGKMLINISDVYCNHTVNKICDPMIEFCNNNTSFTFCGYYGIRMQKRTNSKADKKGVFCEPLFVFEKK